MPFMRRLGPAASSNPLTASERTLGSSACRRELSTPRSICERSSSSRRFSSRCWSMEDHRPSLSPLRAEGMATFLPSRRHHCYSHLHRDAGSRSVSYTHLRAHETPEHL